MSDNLLSESTLVYISWIVSISVGIPVYVYCVYFVLVKMRLDFYSNSVLIVVTCHYLAGYIAISLGLIPLLFGNVQNSLTCTIVTFPISPSGPFLQIMSGMWKCKTAGYPLHSLLSSQTSTEKTTQKKSHYVPIIWLLLCFLLCKG